MAERKRKRRKAQDKRLALHIAASILAASALASVDARPAAAADPPFCAPHTAAPGSAGWDDLDGCWERRPDGGVLFRTGLAGRYYYHTEPPSYSRYAGSGGRWSSGGSSGGYHGAPSAAA